MDNVREAVKVENCINTNYSSQEGDEVQNQMNQFLPFFACWNCLVHHHC